MARLGKHEIWQLCGYASLVSLAWASLAIGLRWQGWVIGMGWGVTIALAGVALMGFLLKEQGADQSEPNAQSESTEKPAPEQETGQFERLDELIEAVGDPVIAIGPDGLVVHANMRASRILGLTRPLTGRYVEEVVTKAELLDRISRGRRGEQWRGSIRLPSAGGVKVCDVSIVPLSDDRPASVVATLRDITELDGALKLKTDFVANASHELRTPIAAIKGAAETLSIAQGDEAMRTKLVGMIESHVLRLEEMINDLLDLSRLESEAMRLELKPVSLALLSEQMSELLADLCAKRNVTLDFDLDPACETIHTDKRLLVLITKNLIENAAKFTAEGTNVRIEARPGEAEGSCVIRVTDRGPGIPLAQQQRIFERFYQVDPARTGAQRGTGLGLAIVKHAARLLNGTVDVESVWQQGTTMIVTLPAHTS